MKIISRRTNKQGKEVLTVELDAGEQLCAFRDDRFYRLGEPLSDEVVYGSLISDACEVQWCSASQQFVR